MTSLERELGRGVSVESVQEAVIAAFSVVFDARVL